MAKYRGEGGHAQHHPPPPPLGVVVPEQGVPGRPPGSGGLSGSPHLMYYYFSIFKYSILESSNI